LVTIRFDALPAETLVEMATSTDNMALFFIEPEQYLARFLNSRSMLFAFTPFNSGQTTTSFRLAGLSEVIGPLSKACQLEALGTKGEEQ
jgi:hypothetical protein